MKQEIEVSIQKWMVEHKKTLALAESVTGGKIAARLTAIPGASDYFLGSLVVYSTTLKQNLLQVAEKTVKEHGAVSKEVVEEMARHLVRITGADYGIAVSGIAGPTGATAEKPIGTIWAALIEKGKAPKVWCFHVAGDRNRVMEGAADHLLAAFYHYLKF